jgi:hypothetical protein
MTAPFRVVIPIPNQGAIIVGSSSAPQRTSCTPRRLNLRRLDFILDLKLVLHKSLQLDKQDTFYP